MAEDGPEAALAALEGLAAVDRSVERDAHHHAHHIGIEAYRHGSHLTDVFPRCTEAFSSGCYHGVIQAHFIASGRVDERVLRGGVTVTWWVSPVTLVLPGGPQGVLEPSESHGQKRQYHRT